MTSWKHPCKCHREASLNYSDEVQVVIWLGRWERFLALGAECSCDGRVTPQLVAPMCLCSRAGPQHWRPQVSIAPGQPHCQPGGAALAACSACSCKPCPPWPTCLFWPASSGQPLLVRSVLLPFHMCRSVIFFTLITRSWWTSHVMGDRGEGVFSSRL